MGVREPKEETRRLPANVEIAGVLHGVQRLECDPKKHEDEQTPPSESKVSAHSRNVLFFVHSAMVTARVSRAASHSRTSFESRGGGALRADAGSAASPRRATVRIAA